MGPGAAAGAALVIHATRAGAEPLQAGPPAECLDDYCVEDSLMLPGDDDPESGPVRTGARGPECTWEHNGDLTSIVNDREFLLQPAPGAVILWQRCDGRFTGDARWFIPGDPTPVLQTPDELAQLIYARLEGTLPAPVLAADPAPGEAAIVSVPTFVAVANWSGTVFDEECDPTGVLCVSVTATPALSFAPGEPGAGTVVCGGAGTRFVVGAGSPAQQAAQPGSCAYAYQLRTGTGDRPGAWPGVVTVTWELTWESTGGASGSLPDIAMSADASRPVHEVQAVVDR